MSKVKKTKTLNCKICGEEVNNVGEDAEKVTCWKCVQAMMRGIIQDCDDTDDDVNN